MGTVEQPSCRVAGFLALDVPRGVLLRRGPTKWVEMVLWDVANDTFVRGQWLHGRVYEGMSDLSPDGRLFIYVARKAKTPGRAASDYTKKWTAISRPPYFTALALWPAGDTWDGGGFFLDARTVWLAHREQRRAHRDHRPGDALSIHFPDEQDESRGQLMLAARDGWELAQKGAFSFQRNAPLHAAGTTEAPWVWQRADPSGQYRLVRELYREPDFSVDALEYVVETASGRVAELTGTTWVDWDQRGRLVFAREGCLHGAEAGDGLLERMEQAAVLVDLNADRPRHVAPPKLAGQWPATDEDLPPLPDQSFTGDD